MRKPITVMKMSTSFTHALECFQGVLFAVEALNYDVLYMQQFAK